MGDILHVGVNVGFALVIYAMVAHWSLLPLALILVFLSKWRILAVQPRFWLPNIKANLVDLVFGISIVGLIAQSPYTWLSLVWTVVYVLWLLFLKPQADEFWVGGQAFLSQLLGLLVLFMIPGIVKMPLVLLAASWIIAWAAARHFFSNYEEPHYRTLGLIWGLLVAQFMWVGLHWIQYYVVFGVKIAVLPLAIAVIMGALGSVYHAYKKNALHRAVVIENGLFAAALLTVMLLTAGWTPRL